MKRKSWLDGFRRHNNLADSRSGHGTRGVRHAHGRLIVAGVADLAAETVHDAGADGSSGGACFGADGDTLRGGAGGADITASSRTVVAESCGRSAGLNLALEERRDGWQRWVDAEDVLGVQKREERDGQEGGIESFGGNHLGRLL